ncbi:amidohydrolase [Niallia sp. NCCP-28]|uniref:amidohydrolase n=1 Tax=Niallia sp. NCCP-28 TaxID=2934712 RepID=UPI0020860233|nr:amidohydrolase [Niallia sp. NCCP-28]GKU81476.1 amidohydrolase [Niallia sp. NCCP-28]
MNQVKECDLIIKNCSILTSEFTVQDDMSIAIGDKKIIALDSSFQINKQYNSKTTLDGKGKLLMPGLIDAHMHTNQQFLRGKITDEYPMIWTRIMVPYESNLDEDAVYKSAQLSCLEMIKSGTTSFVDAGGSYMQKVAESALQAGLRATLTCSTMNTGEAIPTSMKFSEEELIEQNKRLYDDFHQAGEGKINIWFSLRSIITCTPSLIMRIFETAKELNTGVQAHMNEYTNEISFCLERYQKRPLEFLESLGVLDQPFLSAHSILLSDNEIDIVNKHNIKIAHCPISNSGKGFTKTPTLLHKGVSIGLGTDGAAHAGLSLFDQMKVFKSLMRAYWGTPIFDPVVMPSKKILEMATLGGAKASLQEQHIGTLEIGKKADLIAINLNQPHMQPTQNLVNTLVESATSNDVSDMIIDGSIIMKNREVLTLDEEKIMFESKLSAAKIIQKAGI